MHRTTLLVCLCTMASSLLTGCTEQVAACPTPTDVRYEDGRCGPDRDGGAPPVDAQADADAPTCNCTSDEICLPTGACVQCITDDDCADSVCDLGTNECVECNTSSDCPAARPTCSMRACVNTCDRALCRDRFTDTTPACDPVSGGCVECGPDTEADDCGGSSCDPSRLTCTDTTLGSVGLCEPCVRSTECGTSAAGSSMACVETFFGDPPRSVGSYCLVGPATPLEDCPRGTPFRVSSTAIDDMTTRDYCVPTTLTTCPAVFDTSTCVGADASGCGLASEPEDSTCSLGRCRSRCLTTEPFSCGFESDTCTDLSGTPNFCRP